MQYNEFVEKFCGGQSPTKEQAWVISAVLDDTDRIHSWGRKFGRTQLLDWLVRYFYWLDNQPPMPKEVK